MEITLRPTTKQHKVWELLQHNPSVIEVLYGGAAGGGKSWLGCEYLLVMCIQYPGTRYFIGRNELKVLRSSTLQTFHKVAKHHGLEIGKDYSYNGQDNYILFPNSSRVDLLDLKFKPVEDPLFERYGSQEYTQGWIEEAGEVHFNAYDTLKSRVGRHLNEQFNIKGKTLLTCNPKKNWLYKDIYKPWKNNTLPKNCAFIQAFVHDNPHIGSQYIENLQNLRDPIQRQRLLKGNWEYEDDPNALIEYDALTDLFSNHIEESDKKYLTADIARYGRDKTVVRCWKGLRAYRVDRWEKQGIDVTSTKIDKIMADESIPRSRALIDDDGVGGGVVDNLSGVKGFIANARPMPDPRTDELPTGVTKQQYQNLKTQCSYMLADVINNRRMAINCNEPSIQETIIQELEQVKARDSDKEGVLKIMPKDEVKDNIGRSPDDGDTIMMRMYFELEDRSTEGLRPVIRSYGRKDRYRA